MKWHLCSPLGVSERTTEADSEFWAKRRFVPIPKGWFVCSDASYQMGFRTPKVEDLCAKCFRNPPAPGNKKCETCRKRDRQSSNSANAKRSARYGKNAESSTRSASMRAVWAKETPEAKAVRVEKMRSAAQRALDRKRGRERVRQANILRGIELRRQGRTAAALEERRTPAKLARHQRKRDERKAQLSLFGA